MMPQKTIRVLVVDDSATSRQLLVQILESDPAFRVVGEASNGVEAVDKAVKLAPDLITMDVHMPVMDGLRATEQIMTSAPTPILIVSASVSRNELQLSFEAMQAGALMVLPKPRNPATSSFRERRDELISMAKAMAQVKVVRRWGAGAGRVGVGGANAGALASKLTTPTTPLVALSDRRASLVAIGTSTGGPAALRTILCGLPRGFDAPIIVVQHIAKGFVNGLASWLASGCSLRVKIAVDAEKLESGTVYIGPDDRHIGVRKDGKVILSDEPPIGGFRPSATFLFETVARAYGPAVVALILTGMGNDGVAGLKEVHAAGGRVIAQNEGSSVVYGMAQEAAREGVVDVELPLESLAQRLVEAVR